MADDKEEEKFNSKITSGNVAGQIASLALNPSREKIKEFTYINRFQATLFPLLDTIIAGRKYLLEIALYLQNPIEYKKTMKQQKLPQEPVLPNLAEELLYSTAQWQKSIAGKNLERGLDLATAEIESKAGEDDELTSFDKDWDK